MTRACIVSEKKEGEHMPGFNKEELLQKRSDTDSLIREVLQKIPQERKIEALRLVEGFALCANSDKKAG